MAKPRFNTGPASAYAGHNERILEFSNQGRGGKLLGGLVSVSEPEPGKLVIEIYRCDAGVEIVTPLSPMAAVPEKAGLHEAGR